MWTKRILIFLPVAVTLFLLQSYFWVPTYEQQARATPARLRQYISGSIGDAQILNPILNADNASSTVCGYIFEGLIDRDENLNFRGRLAESWEISEEAYFVVDPKKGQAPADIAHKIRLAKLSNIISVEAVPSETVTHKVTEDLPPEEGQPPEPVELTITVRMPERVKITLKEVDQDLFTKLKDVLGEDVFGEFDAVPYVDIAPEKFSHLKATAAGFYLPATEHNPVILFHLRKGVLFHDGHEFDSGDVKFTYDAIVNPKNLSPRVPDYEPVKAVEIIDDYTVRIVYKRLFSPAFGTWGMGILPEHLLNDECMRTEAEDKKTAFDEFGMRKSAFNRNPIGCGPFRFVDWKSDEYIKLTRFDDYWEGAPGYKEYVFRIIPDLLTQEMEFYAGAVDSYGAKPHQVARFSKDTRYQNFSGLSLGYTYIGYNMRREPFNDVRVRKALAMAIDIDKIIKYVLYDQGEKMTGPFPKQTDFYNFDIESPPYDPEQAVALLEEAGWTRNNEGWLEKDGKPLSFTLMTNNGNPLRKDILTIAQDSWKKIGIDVQTDLLEWTVFIGKHVDQGDFDAIILGWGMGLDPDLYQIWHSSQTNPHQLNFVGYSNPEADDLIVRIRREYDHDRQVEMCHRLHGIIAEDQPYTFLYVGKWTALLDKKIYVAQRDESGAVVGYERIRPTKTGNYSFYFNKWVKLAEEPEMVAE